MENEKIATKVDITWYMLSLYLEDLQNSAMLFTQDQELNRRYTALRDYVDEKLALPKYDIEDTYVVVEYVAPPKNG